MDTKEVFEINAREEILLCRQTNQGIICKGWFVHSKWPSENIESISKNTNIPGGKRTREKMTIRNGVLWWWNEDARAMQTCMRHG